MNSGSVQCAPFRIDNLRRIVRAVGMLNRGEIVAVIIANLKRQVLFSRQRHRRIQQ